MTNENHRIKKKFIEPIYSWLDKDIFFRWKIKPN